MVLVLLLTLFTFAAVTTGIVSGYYWLSAESPTTRRLRTLVPNVSVAAPPAIQRERRPGILARFFALLGSYSFGGSENSISRRLSFAGIRGPTAVALFLGVRTLVSFGPALVVLVPRISAGQPLGRSLFLAGIIWAIGHTFVNMWLRAKGARRMREITHALPDSLDLMVTCLEAGLGLNATIARIGEERAEMKDPLGHEFSQVALELRSGRSREDALRGLGDRNGVEDLKGLVALVIQSDRLGASMAQTLRAHADLLRTKRRQRAEEAARKLPIKMLFPLAFFILPALFVVVGGPAMLRLKDLVDLVVNR
jgi:tight adherence protein C